MATISAIQRTFLSLLQCLLCAKDVSYNRHGQYRMSVTTDVDIECQLQQTWPVWNASYNRHGQYRMSVTTDMVSCSPSIPPSLPHLIIHLFNQQSLPPSIIIYSSIYLSIYPFITHLPTHLVWQGSVLHS